MTTSPSPTCALGGSWPDRQHLKAVLAFRTDQPYRGAMDDKIWANSGDSHLVEPDDLFTDGLPRPRWPIGCRAASRTTTASGRRSTSTASSSGAACPRPSVSPTSRGARWSERAPGANDKELRLRDLDGEGIWGELVYPSIGIWMSSIQDPELHGRRLRGDQRLGHRVPALLAALRVHRDDPAADGRRPRWQRSSAPPGWASRGVPLRRAGARWRRLERRRAGSRSGPRSTRPGWWSRFHIGTEPHDASSFHGGYFRGPGGALINYMETTYGGQRAVTKMIARGRLRPPSDAQGDRVRGRCDVGAVRRRSARRGLSPALVAGAAAARAVCRASTSTRTSTRRSSTTGRRSRR